MQTICESLCMAILRLMQNFYSIFMKKTKEEIWNYFLVETFVCCWYAWEVEKMRTSFRFREWLIVLKIFLCTVRGNTIAYEWLVTSYDYFTVRNKILYWLFIFCLVLKFICYTLSFYLHYNCFCFVYFYIKNNEYEWETELVIRIWSNNQHTH